MKNKLTAFLLACLLSAPALGQDEPDNSEYESDDSANQVLTGVLIVGGTVGLLAAIQNESKKKAQRQCNEIERNNPNLTCTVVSPFNGESAGVRPLWNFRRDIAGSRAFYHANIAPALTDKDPTLLFNAGIQIGKPDNYFGFGVRQQMENGYSEAMVFYQMKF